MKRNHGLLIGSFAAGMALALTAWSQDGAALNRLLNDLTTEEAAPVADTVADAAAAPEAAPMTAPEAPAVPAEPATPSDLTPAAPEAPMAPVVPAEPAAAEATAVPAEPAIPSDLTPAAPEAPADEPASLDSLLGSIQGPEEAAPAAEAPAVPEAPATPAEAPAAEPTATPEQPAAEETTVVTKPMTPEELAQAEEIRRQNDEVEGLKLLGQARQAAEDGDYEKAFAQYENALGKIPSRDKTEAARAEARQGAADAALEMARGKYEKSYDVEDTSMQDARKVLDEARTDLANAQKYGAVIQRLSERIEARDQRIVKKMAVPLREAQKPERIEQEQSISSRFATAKQLFALEDYDGAEAQFEQVLLQDPYNRDAMRFLQKIEERRLKVANIHRGATRADMIEDVRRNWNPPIRRGVTPPPETKKGAEQGPSGNTREIMDKLQKIKLSKIDFREANVIDVIRYIREMSRANDPAGVGVNILTKLDSGTAAASAATPDASAGLALPPPDALPGLPPLEGAPMTMETAAPALETFAPTGGSSAYPPITLSLNNVSLLDAIKYVTELANLKYRVEENAVIITSASEVARGIVTRLYPVMPNIIEVLTTRSEQEAAGGGGGGGEFTAMTGGGLEMTKKGIKEQFEEMGVPFPPGTSIYYNAAISHLIVRNTPENLETFERILAALNVVPTQVEIEARFVEIAQDDLRELGFEWLLTDSFEVATKKGSGPLEGRERIVVNRNAGSGGFTSGMRYFNDNGESIIPAAWSTTTAAGMVGDIMSVSSILTNPELNVVLHALDQKGGADLLSSPRVTTRSGVNAQIKVVEEIIYPTEWESQQMNVQAGGAIVQPGQEAQPIMDRPPVPGSFETREVGVILNVTPTVGPDGYTIELTMSPEVAELVRWIDYGPPGFWPIYQPVFSSRNLTTSIVLWDGQTVAMGGLIREVSKSIDDKIPLLGDIPIIGRLFSNKGEANQKQNLVIFVTARIVDPAGNPVHSQSATGTPTGTTAPGTESAP